MIPILKTNKKQIAIVCAAVLLCSLLAALYVSYRIKPIEPEPVPIGRIHDAGAFGDNIIVHDSTEGEIVIGADSTETTVEVAPLAAAPLKTVADPETIWKEDTYAGNHTLVEKAQLKNGSIGVLIIPTLNLSVNVYESSDNMEAMNKRMTP